MHTSFKADRRYDRPRFTKATTTAQDKERFGAYYKNKAAFDSIQDALLYDEPTNASVETLRNASAYLESLQHKTKEIVEAIQNAPKTSSNRWDDDEENFDVQAFTEKSDLGAAWKKKLQGLDLHFNYRSVADYIHKLPEYSEKLEAMRWKIEQLESRAEKVREKEIATTTYDDTNLLIVNYVPKELKVHPSDKIDQEEVNQLQSTINNSIATKQKTYFAVLSKAPLVKLDAKKNKLVISIETISEEDIIPGMRKLFDGKQTKIDEALSNGRAGVLRAIKDTLKQEFRFVKDDDFDTPNASKIRA